MPPTTANPVTVSLADLSSSVPFSTLSAAFGPTSLGILVVSDLPPRYQELRIHLLTLARDLGNLPEEELKKLECAEAKYLVGWSKGKEKLANNKPDTLKGSFYVNCQEASQDVVEKYKDLPEYTHANIWPSEELLKGFKETFQELCDLIISTAVLVARGCDLYATSHIPSYPPSYLETIVRNSTTTKARLLHYFPSPPSSESSGSEDWCGTHLDHGCLTGLTSALYFNGTPEPEAGLYIQDRTGQTVKVDIPEDCLAFQTGEALERITRGEFKAVPHLVRGSSKEGVSRSTLAVFTQPNLWEMVDLERKLDFAAFARGIVDNNTTDGK